MNKSIATVNKIDRIDEHYFDQKWARKFSRGTKWSGMYKDNMKSAQPKKKSKWPTHGWE